MGIDATVVQKSFQPRLFQDTQTPNHELLSESSICSFILCLSPFTLAFEEIQVLRCDYRGELA